MGKEGSQSPQHTPLVPYLRSALYFNVLMLADDLCTCLRVQEEFAHLIDIFELNVFPARKRGQDGGRCEQLQRIPSERDEQQANMSRGFGDLATYRSELLAPFSANRSNTPSPSLRSSTFARSWMTFAIEALSYRAVRTIRHLITLARVSLRT